MTQIVEQNEKEQRKELLKARAKEMEAKEKELNAGKEGVGRRWFLGLSRGRNPQEIKYEAWDDTKPDTLPTTLQFFLDELKNDEAQIVKRLILGDNELAYTEASDPVAEHINGAWPADTKARFRVAVRNYANDADVSIEEAVALIKPGIEKAYQKEVAANQAK